MIQFIIAQTRSKYPSSDGRRDTLVHLSLAIDISNYRYTANDNTSANNKQHKSDSGDSCGFIYLGRGGRDGDKKQTNKNRWVLEVKVGEMSYNYVFS